MHDFDESIKQILANKHYVRIVSAQSFQEAVGRTERLSPSHQMTIQDRQVAEHITSERYKWLERFEGELVEENVRRASFIATEKYH